MKILRYLSAVVLACSMSAGPVLAQDAARLNGVLAQLDAASKRFKNARAEVVTENYSAAARDTDTDKGPIYFIRSGKSVQMGAVTLDPATNKARKVYQYKDGLFQLYDVGVNQVRDMKAGANSSQYESFLTLGFGGSGKDLANAWNITDLGGETLSDDGQPVKTEKLSLVSKDTNTAAKFTRITIWIDPSRGVSLRQVIETHEHDKRTTNFSHIKLNGKIDLETFAISKKAQHISS